MMHIKTNKIYYKVNEMNILSIVQIVIGFIILFLYVNLIITMDKKVSNSNRKKIKDIIELRDKLKDRQNWLINSINIDLDDAITLRDLTKLKVSVEKEIDKQNSLI